MSYPFTDLSSAELRPAVVVSPSAYPTGYGDVVLIALTTQPQRDAGLALAHWREAGLPRPTWVKPIIMTIASSRVVRRIGSLRRDDRTPVMAAVSETIAPTFVKT